MVVLRLLVKIPPPQLQTGHSFGGVNSTNHSNGDGATETMFMLILRNPEKISMRTLTGQIQDKWMKLRPGFGYALHLIVCDLVSTCYVIRNTVTNLDEK
jgi:hypothetical protein